MNRKYPSTAKLQPKETRDLSRLSYTEPRFARRTGCSSSTERKFKLQNSQCAIYGIDLDVAGGLWPKALSW